MADLVRADSSRKWLALAAALFFVVPAWGWGLTPTASAAPLAAAAPAAVAPPAVAPPAVASGPNCADLGAADTFSVFAGGNISLNGTSSQGRIAAAGDISLNAVGINASSPAVVAGGSITTGANGGSVSGGATYGQNLSQAGTFTFSPAAQKQAPSFSFPQSFVSLGELSAGLAAQAQTAGATEVAQYGALTLTAPTPNPSVVVFHVSEADLAGAQGLVFNNIAAATTVIVDVDGTAPLTISAQYANVNGGGKPSDIVWNFSLVPSIQITTGIGWPGTLLAPTSSVSGTASAQFQSGQVIAGELTAPNWVIGNGLSTACIPNVSGSTGGGTAPVAPAIIPMVECITTNSSGGGFVAYFGYTNPGAAVTIPAGPTNSLTPASLTGQTTSFEAGTVPQAFSVNVPSGTAQWSINGVPATATSGSPACNDDVLPVDPSGISLIFAVVAGGLVGALVVWRTVHRAKTPKLS